MTEGFKMLLAALEKAAAEGKIMVGNADDLPKELKDVMAKIVSRLEDHEHFKEEHKIAILSRELGDSISSGVIASAKAFIEINGLPKEELLNYIIYGAIANTLRFIIENNDDDENDCECDHCHSPKEPSNDNGSAKEEFESSDSDLDADAALAAINALKTILSNSRG